MSDHLLSQLTQSFSFLEERPSVDHPAVNCPQTELIGFLRSLRDEWGFDMLMDVTAIDEPEETPRFTVVYHLFKSEGHEYLRIASGAGEGEEPEHPTACDIWPAANWHERETFDMFGIRFTGHPDLRRILMWDEYPYYPLRKEFPLAGIEVPLPAEDVAEATGASLIAAPMMGGPFVASSGKPMSEAEPRAKDESWTEKNEKPES